MSERLIIRTAPVERIAETVARLDLPEPIVLGLPPCGLLVASRVARALDAPLDLLLPHDGDVDGARDHRVAWPALAGRSAVLVDDGQADPSAWPAALAAVRLLRPDCLAIVVPELGGAVEQAVVDEYGRSIAARARRTGGSGEASPVRASGQGLLAAPV